MFAATLTHPLILGLNFLKLAKLTVNFETNTVETGSTLYPANTHCMQTSNSTIIAPKPDVYRPCQLLLNKKACWMIALMLTIVIILTAVASTPIVILMLLLRNRTNPLFHLNVTILRKNY